jgi:hypothetical protein
VVANLHLVELVVGVLLGEDIIMTHHLKIMKWEHNLAPVIGNHHGGSATGVKGCSMNLMIVLAIVLVGVLLGEDILL